MIVDFEPYIPSATSSISLCRSLRVGLFSAIIDCTLYRNFKTKIQSENAYDLDSSLPSRQ